MELTLGVRHVLRGEGVLAQAACFIFACFAGGLSFGAIWPHLVLLASELFGSANLAVN